MRSHPIPDHHSRADTCHEQQQKKKTKTPAVWPPDAPRPRTARRSCANPRTRSPPFVDDVNGTDTDRSVSQSEDGSASGFPEFGENIDSTTFEQVGRSA